MTISSSVRKAGPFIGNGATTLFPFAFKVFDKTNVAVIRADSLGTSTTLTLDSDYSVTLNANQNNNPGGTITYPITGTPLPQANTLTLLGSLVYSQPTSLTNSGGFYPATVEDALDRAEIQIQQLAEIGTRAIQVPPADGATSVLPAAGARASTVLGFDSVGGLTLLPLPATVGAGDLRTDRFISSVLPNPLGLPTFIAGTTAAITLSRAPGTVDNVTLHFDGTYQGKENIQTLVGAALTFTAPIPVGTQMVYATTGTVLSANTPALGSVADVALAAGSAIYRRAFDVRSFNDFGAVGDGVTDDTVAIGKALTWVQAGAFSVGAPVRTLYQPAGYLFKTSSTLGVSVPCAIRCESHIYYYGTTGSAFVVGLVAPAGGINRNYDLWFSGFHHAVGNTAAAPTGINDSGANGFEIRNMQFSNVYVGELLGFTRNGFYGNSTNDTFSGQHCQDNDIRLGQVAYNGRGFFANSVSAATGAYQVNRTHIQNAFSNFKNFTCDTGVGGMAANASSSNHFTGTLDAPAAGGSSFEFNSQYSTFDFMFITGSVVFSSTSGYNRFNVGNNFTTGVAMFDGGINNWLTTNGPDTSQLPVSIIVPVAAQQNAFGVPVSIGIGATVIPNAGGATQVVVYLGETAGTLVEFTRATMPASSQPAVMFPLSFPVGPMKWWLVQASGAGTVTFSQARCVMNG